MGGEPNNAIGGTEHCAHMGSSKYKNAWTDIPCSKSYDNFLLMCSYNLRTGIPGDVSYCTSSGPCTFGQGDCDKDTECSGSLVCGKDNCRDFNSKAEPSYDCCTNVVDGGWSSWSYGACSKTCGGGTQRGTRSCNNPRPSNGGKICAGSGVTTRQCNIKSCPVEVRLTSYPKGRVELYKNGKWGTLCGHYWWNNEKGAENICRQLGYTGGTKYTAPGGTGPIQTGNRLCKGGEATIWDCPLKRGELDGCTHNIDQGVACTGTRGKYCRDNCPAAKAWLYNPEYKGGLCWCKTRLS